MPNNSIKTVKYMLNESPYYDKTLEEASKGYVRYLAVEGQALSPTELNVMQGLIYANLKKVTDLLIEDGCIISGLNFSSNDTTCIVSEGEIYANGLIIKTNETAWPIQSVPSDMLVIYASVIPQIITEKDDPSLYNGAQNYEGAEIFGGHRLKYSASIEYILEENYNDAAKTAMMEKGEIYVPILKVYGHKMYGPIKPNPLYGKLYDQIAKRTYDVSGDFIAKGLNISTEKHPRYDTDVCYNIKLTSGCAYIKGYEYTYPDDFTVTSKGTIDTKTLGTPSSYPAEKFSFNGAREYTLNNKYVCKINNITAVIKGTFSVSNTGLLSDVITGMQVKDRSLIVSVSKVKATINGVVTELTDWTYTGGKIVWSIKPANLPATYYAEVNYSSNFIPARDYLVINNDDNSTTIKLLNLNILQNSTVDISYSWYLHRIDAIYINNEGYVIVKNGISSEKDSIVPPTIPHGVLPIAYINIIPNTDPGQYPVKLFNIYAVPVSQLQTMKNSLERLEKNVALSKLENDARMKHAESDFNYSLKNIFVDAIIDYTKADFGDFDFSSTVDVFSSEITLPLIIDQLRLTNDKGEYISEITDSKSISIFDDNGIDKNKTGMLMISTTDVVDLVDCQPYRTKSESVTPEWFKSLIPSLVCNPKFLAQVVDDPKINTVWLPNRVIYSSNNVNETVRTTAPTVTNTVIGYGSTSSSTSTSVSNSTRVDKQSEILGNEVIEVKKSAINAIANPYLKENTIVKVIGTDFPPNMEIRLSLDGEVELIPNKDDLVFNVDSNPVPSVSNTLSNPSYEVQNIRPCVWEISKYEESIDNIYNTSLIVGNTWKITHNSYDLERGISYYYNDKNDKWTYKYNDAAVFQTLSQVPSWLKFITRTAWFQKYITDSDFSDEVKSQLLDFNLRSFEGKYLQGYAYDKNKSFVVTDLNGKFEINIILPPETTIGRHRIIAETMVPPISNPDLAVSATVEFGGVSGIKHWEETISKRNIEKVHETIYSTETITTQTVITAYSPPPPVVPTPVYVEVPYIPPVTPPVVVVPPSPPPPPPPPPTPPPPSVPRPRTWPISDREERGGNEPLAQSFKLDKSRFLTKLDLYFTHKPIKEEGKVWINIREMVNGLPVGKNIYYHEIQWSEIPNSVLNTSGTENIPYSINFKYPVFVEGEKEYCFVIGATVVGYRILIAQMGQRDLITKTALTFQPHLTGVMFKSSNDKSWSPVQDSDITYALYASEFNTESTYYIKNFETTIGEIALVNVSVNNIQFENTAIHFYYTITNENMYNTTSWKPLPLEEKIKLTKSDWEGSDKKLYIKCLLQSNDKTITPVINLNTMEIFLAKYKNSGSYIQISCEIE